MKRSPAHTAADRNVGAALSAGNGEAILLPDAIVVSRQQRKCARKILVVNGCDDSEVLTTQTICALLSADNNPVKHQPRRFHA